MKYINVHFQPRGFKNIAKFFISLAGCLVIYGQTISAAEFQAGASFLALSKSDEYDRASVIMPTVGLQTSLDAYRLLKLELGFLNYSVEKIGHTDSRVLSDGDIEAHGYSIAGILSTKAVLTTKERQMNFNIGFGFVSYDYDNTISSDAQKLENDSGLTRVKEKIYPTAGVQLILGMDFLLSQNLLLAFEARYIDIRPQASIYFNEDGEEIIKNEKLDFSHAWIGVNIVYLFDF